MSRATSLDRDTFLKLLVAQLKYQDPSKPVDASEMISQSAELSVVEKLDAISQALAETQATNRLTLGGSMIGKQITFVGADETLVTETVTSVSFDGTAMVLRRRLGRPDRRGPVAGRRPATTGTATTGTTTDTGGATDTADTSTTAS
ncbi:MAG: flagellar hook capping FlgD N-terminal domain-containing protein [Ilumatobacteraceae bacterium]